MNFFGRFPLWQYFQQSLFNPDSPALLNPHRYWQRYSYLRKPICKGRILREPILFKAIGLITLEQSM
ncbi:MAG: hypothetical protein ACFB14_08075 [Leptolyngbyaceae cyanobacterium]